MATVTAFRPSVHGFRFPNRFPSVPAREVDLVVTKVKLGDASDGLCGGMVYAALDYFHAGRQTPPDTHPPPSGPLFDYLVDRLLDSWMADGMNGTPAGLTYLHLMSGSVPDEDRFWTRFSPWRSRAWVIARSALPKVREDIDAGRPSPLGLVRALSWDPRKLGQHHQMVAWGYDVVGTSVTLNVYDPNRANDDHVTLTFDVARTDRKIEVFRTPPSDKRIHCFFPPGYNAATPP
jgi:hypothetical protein